MITSKIIAGVVLALIGLLFFFKNKTIGKGAYGFYRKLYTEKNLKIMFKIFGIFLIILGAIIVFTK